MASDGAIEGRWFTIVVFIASALLVIAFIANAIYWDRIRKGSCSAVTKKEADVLFWVNVVAGIVSGIIMLWALWRFINGPTYYKELKARAKAATQALRAPQGYIRTEGGFLSAVPASPPLPVASEAQLSSFTTKDIQRWLATQAAVTA